MMTADELIRDVARVLSGLEVARSVSTVPFGAALEPWDRLHRELVNFGWHGPEHYEQAIREILGLPGGEPASCTAEVRHGPGHQSSTRCELKGPHEVHRAIYGSRRQEATWRGPYVYTDIIDDPPADES